jgi:NitT/TauT family transport system substrate-binding protein
MSVARQIRFFLVAGVLAGATALGAVQAGADDRVILQLDWIPTGHHQAPYAGIKEGYFKEERIDLDIRRGLGAADALTKVATGAAPFGYTDIVNVMSTPASHVKAIMSIDFEVPHAVIVRAETGIRSFADLAGHSVATAPTASSNLFFPLVLKAAGADISKIRIVSVDPSALAPMLLTKRVDGVMMWMTNLEPRLKPEADKVGIELVALPFVAVNGDMYGSVIIANEQTLAGQPDLVRRFVRALRRSYLYMRDHPEATAAHVKSLIPQQNLDTETASVKDSLKYMFTWKDDEHTFGRFDPAKLKTTHSWIVRAVDTDPAVDPETYLDRRFFQAE